MEMSRTSVSDNGPNSSTKNLSQWKRLVWPAGELPHPRVDILDSRVVTQRSSRDLTRLTSRCNFPSCYLNDTKTFRGASYDLAAVISSTMTVDHVLTYESLIRPWLDPRPRETYHILDGSSSRTRAAEYWETRETLGT
ncbi:hypothetical protein E2C01_017975 [Portunus trituberculatus]|uniref:Uncharacterized protein n=1 Tax=Portunus trituberculatus TaxID=210409 RepID=A0A5B7DTB7_PORTR|nr:hypothetical protein [Portunus trituberculatus]